VWAGHSGRPHEEVDALLTVKQRDGGAAAKPAIVYRRPRRSVDTTRSGRWEASWSCCESLAGLVGVELATPASEGCKG
jgi:hypothetical protein